MIGQIFGELTVAAQQSRAKWQCVCSCGGSRSAESAWLKTGRITTCGSCVKNRMARGVARCSRCCEEKPLQRFDVRPERQGHPKSTCRDCASLKNKAQYQADVDVSRSKRREYAKLDNRHAARVLANQRANPAKRRAQLAVQYAVAKGEMVRPAACCKCGATYRVEGHHDDYAKPLDVIWLCTGCHRERHRELLRLGIDPEASTRPQQEVA